MLAVNVIEPLGEWEMLEDGHDMIVDLRPVFRSDLDQPLAYEVVSNSRADLVQAEYRTMGVAPARGRGSVWSSRG